MKKIILGVLLQYFGLGNGSDVLPMIIGGEPIAWQEHKYFVSLRTASNQHFCGGSLISPDYVITAAHCVEYGPPRSIVFHDKTHDSVVAVNIHPQYANNSHDIALLKLTHSHEDIPQIPLSLDQEIVHEPLYTMGFGFTKPGVSTLPKQLQGVVVPFVPNSICSQPRSYGSKIDRTMLCAGYPEGQKDSCSGDSGGPLIRSVGGQDFLVGIVSWGEGCAKPNKYGVYSRIRSLGTWALDSIDMPVLDAGDSRKTGRTHVLLRPRTRGIKHVRYVAWSIVAAPEDSHPSIKHPYRLNTQLIGMNKRGLYTLLLKAYDNENNTLAVDYINFTRL